MGGDDAITNQIGQRLIGNSNCIWTFSDEQIEEMSKPLQEKWKKYADYIATFQDEFNSYWDEYNQLSSNKLYEESGKMPIIETNSQYNNNDPEGRCKEIYNNIVTNITYGSIGYRSTTLYTLSKNILSYAKLHVPEGYQVKFQKKSTEDDVKCDYGTDGSISGWYGKLYVYLLDATDETTGEDKYYYSPTDYWYLPIESGYLVVNEKGKFTNSYFKWMKQQLEIQLQEDTENRFQPKYDTDYQDSVSNHLNDADYYKNYFAEYSRNRLQSFNDAYNSCSVIIGSLAGQYANTIQEKFNYIVDNGTVSEESIYDRLMGKYHAFMDYIIQLIKESQDKINAYQQRMDELIVKINQINRICPAEVYFGDLYKELMIFKREDVYENNNFVSDVLDEDLMPNIEELILDAKQEAAKACQSEHNINITLGNILTADSFSSQIDYIAPGNYVRTRIQGILTKMRIIEITVDFDNIETSNIVFSDVTVGYQPIRDVKNKLDKAASMASSFDFVAKQSTRNDKQVSKFNDMFSNGLSAANTLIKNNENEDFVIDNYGILGRQRDKDAETYDDCQLRITHNIFGFTTDNWNTLSMAIGKIIWNGEILYGVIAEALVGKMVMSEKLGITNQSGTYTIDDNGFKMSKDGSYIMFDPSNPSIVAHNKYGEDVLDFNSDGEGDLVIKGKIDGGSINIGDGFSVDENGKMQATGAKIEGSFDITGGEVNIDTDYNATNSIILHYKNDNSLLYRNILINKDGFSYETELVRDGRNRIENVLINSNSITFSGKERAVAGDYTVSITADENGLECDEPLKAKEIYANNMKSGYVVGNITATNKTVSVDVELDMPTIPTVVATPVTSNPLGVSVSVADVTKTGFKIYMSRSNVHTGVLSVNWIAMC